MVNVKGKGKKVFEASHLWSAPLPSPFLFHFLPCISVFHLSLFSPLVSSAFAFRLNAKETGKKGSMGKMFRSKVKVEGKQEKEKRNGKGDG